MLYSTRVYNNLRARIEYIPFDSVMYRAWIKRAALCAWNPAYPIENMIPVDRVLLPTGGYVYFFVKGDN